MDNNVNILKGGGYEDEIIQPSDKDTYIVNYDYSIYLPRNIEFINTFEDVYGKG